MYYKNIVLLLCIALIGSTSCKRQAAKTSQNPQRDSVTVTQADTIKQVPVVVEEKKPEKVIVNVKNNDFKYFSAKSKVLFKTEKQEQNANLNIRIRKDSVIWLSGSLMGIEGVRAVISPKGATLLDRINRQYHELDFAALSQQFNFNLNFGLIQSILVGNMPLNQREGDENSIKDGHYLVHQHENQLIVDNYINQNTGKLYLLDVSEASNDNHLQLSYQQFQDVLGQLFPHQSNAQINFVKEGKTQTTLIQLEHQRIETTGQNLTFPFSIPSSYTKAR